MKTQNKPQTVLYLGGCRSGKSRLAEEYCRGHCKSRTYVATLTVSGDEEMKQRIELHTRQRGRNWHLVEEPFDLCGLLRSTGEDGVMLIDCLTMWLTNMLLADKTDAEVEGEVRELCVLLGNPPCTVVLVANEVGLGVVPESSLGRRFRDLAGWANQQVAASCQRVLFIAGGLPLVLKDEEVQG
ncbi:MAG: bifunctional adenosylcobinamide kinase/adenosylcobinamide-phosphate guanylyltransferase [Desulfobulbaceae bacterium]|jgi:adenosylcobinamide kinase/adenosylcobinamide-phosphate guanylyltransferase|nr:bifunctional adenosylcobinamide kinase/adenosylcobinamide-phosphate guanylyltransferase [Desulfobulbaceae bacterium]